MSRTTRRPRPKFWGNRYRAHKTQPPKRVRDGLIQYFDRTCRNHGSCDYCANNRTHTNRRREPLLE